MCLPLAIAALGATAAGAVLSGIGSQQQASASNRAREQDDAQYNAMVNQGRIQQQQMADKKYQQLDKTMNNATVQNQNAQQQQESTNLGNQYGQSMSALANTGAPIPGLIQGGANDPGTQVINSTFAGQNANTDKYLQQQAGAKANIDARGNVNLADQLFNQNTGNQISLFQNAQQGNTQALNTNLGLQNRKAQMDQWNAQSSGSGLSMLGSLVSGVGGMASKFAHF